MTDRLLAGVRVTIVGAGAAGSALGRALRASGVEIASVISRTDESAGRLADELGVAHWSDRLEDAFESSNLLVLAVTDDALPAIAEALGSRDGGWIGRTVLHLSGSLASSVLDPLRRQGAEVASFHPMLPLRSDSSPDVFAGAWVSIEGTEPACEFGRQLARALGARPMTVDAHTKSAIHAVASIASNYLVTLMTVASDLLAETRLDTDAYELLFRPLVDRTLSNIDFADPARALTGPISRGDSKTVRNHLRVLREDAPEYLVVLAALMAETTRVASRAGRITDQKATEILDLIHEAVDQYSHRS